MRHNVINLASLLVEIKELENKKMDLFFKLITEYNRSKIPEILVTEIDELELSVRASNCLKNVGYLYIGDLVCNPEFQSNLLKIKNLGLNTHKEILDKLKDHGITDYIHCEDYKYWRAQISLKIT
jgi:DNA-directed RNA polymerase alpha subunit